MSKPTVTDTVWDNFKQIFIAVILAVVIKTSIVEAYKIPSSSMEDTLLIGDFLLANKFSYGARLPVVDWRLPAISDPEPGDIVIFLWPVIWLCQGIAWFFRSERLWIAMRVFCELRGLDVRINTADHKQVRIWVV